MTKILFRRDDDGLISSVDLCGHAGYAEEGEDIICAAISSAIQLTHALLSDVQGLVFDTTIEEDGAHILLSFPENVREAAQAGLTALELHYTEMQENYSEYIQVTEVHYDAEN